MVLKTLLLAYAAALICLANAEEEWKPVPLEGEIPIDFDTSKLQLSTIGFGAPPNKQIWVYFNAGEDKGAGGMEFQNFDGKYHWRILGCGEAGTKYGTKGMFTEDEVSQERNKEQIFTIWREDTLLLNLMVDDTAVLDNYAVLNEITGESCNRDDTFWSYSDRMDFTEDYKKKVTSISIYDASEYRIIPREGKDEEEKGGEEGGDEEKESYTNGENSPGELINFLMTLSTALTIAFTLV